MDTSPADEAFGRWHAAMLDSLISPERVLAWQDRRYRFAHQVGQLLTNPARPDATPITGHVVYGVHVAGAGLLYVGQTGTLGAGSVTCRSARATISPRRCRQRHGSVSSSSNGLTWSLWGSNTRS